MVDATWTPNRDGGGRREAMQDKRNADAWIRGGSKDYRLACIMAGLDPEFIRDSYIAGRIDRARLKNLTEVDDGQA